MWWRQHKLGAGAVYAVTLVLSLLGATWALFVLYIVSFGLLVYLLTSLAKLGLGNRQVIGQSCHGWADAARPARIDSADCFRWHSSGRFIGAGSDFFCRCAYCCCPSSSVGPSRGEGRGEKACRWTYLAVALQLLVAWIVWLIYASLWILALLSVPRWLLGERSSPPVQTGWPVERLRPAEWKLGSAVCCNRCATNRLAAVSDSLARHSAADQELRRVISRCAE